MFVGMTEFPFLYRQVPVERKLEVDGRENVVQSSAFVRWNPEYGWESGVTTPSGELMQVNNGMLFRAYRNYQCMLAMGTLHAPGSQRSGSANRRKQNDLPQPTLDRINTAVPTTEEMAQIVRLCQQHNVPVPLNELMIEVMQARLPHASYLEDIGIPTPEVLNHRTIVAQRLVAMVEPHIAAFIKHDKHSPNCATAMLQQAVLCYTCGVDDLPLIVGAGIVTHHDAIAPQLIQQAPHVTVVVMPMTIISVERIAPFLSERFGGLAASYVEPLTEAVARLRTRECEDARWDNWTVIQPES